MAKSTRHTLPCKLCAGTGYEGHAGRHGCVRCAGTGDEVVAIKRRIVDEVYTKLPKGMSASDEKFLAACNIRWSSDET